MSATPPSVRRPTSQQLAVTVLYPLLMAGTSTLIAKQAIDAITPAADHHSLYWVFAMMALASFSTYGGWLGWRLRHRDRYEGREHRRRPVAVIVAAAVGLVILEVSLRYPVSAAFVVGAMVGFLAAITGLLVWIGWQVFRIWADARRRGTKPGLPVL